jgi:hypothetical protein
MEAGLLSPLKIAGEISRGSSRLAIQFTLLGNLATVDIPMPSDMPARKNALWEETCFELFLAAHGSSRYREINLSPAGHWNVFRFDDYRNGMREDMAFGSLLFSVCHRPGSLSLFLEIELDRIIRSCQLVDVGISSVIRYKSGKTGYWALCHLDQQADFHRRDSFVIEL